MDEELTEVQQAYKDWKAIFKVSMMVHTDEQMFEIGYRARDWYIKELEDLVLKLSKNVVKLAEETEPTKPKRSKKNAPESDIGK